MTPQDEEREAIHCLVARVRDGDEAALAVLLARYRPLIAWCARRQAIGLGDPAVSAEDLAQEAAAVFVELAKAYRSERGCAFGSYLKRHLAWRMHNWARRARRRWREQPLDDQLVHDLERRKIGRREEEKPVPESGAVVQLHEELSRLSPRQRQVIFLYYWQDCPATAIAAQMGLSVRAVERLRQRAERKLRESLGEER